MHSIDSLQYLIDIGNSSVFNTPISFTSKYPNLDHYQKILSDQNNFLTLMSKMVLHQNIGQQIDLPKLITQSGFKQQVQESVTQVLKAKYGDYKKQFIKRQVYQGGRYLAGFNWKIKVHHIGLQNVVGCNQFSHKNRMLIRLQLYLSQGKYDNHLHDPIILQLGIAQARQFIIKLKQISKNLKL